MISSSLQVSFSNDGFIVVVLELIADDDVKVIVELSPLRLILELSPLRGNIAVEKRDEVNSIIKS